MAVPEYFDDNGYERGVGILDSVLRHSMADTPIDLFLRAEALRVKASLIINCIILISLESNLRNRLK